MTQDPATHAVSEARDRIQHQGTWVVMLDGILLILLGVFLVIPDESAHDLIIRGLGILLCVAAIMVGARLWTSAMSRHMGPLAWLACIAPAVIGLILIIWPRESLEAIAVTVGVVVLLRGIIETAVGLSVRPQKGWEFLSLRGVVTIALGIFFLAFRSWAAYLLLILLGIDLIARGATGVSTARALRRADGSTS
ncbi:MAG: DUF308 domain-containing protein [Phycisphaerales bacterium]|nr:DUF308 domain-containing protein [Phycisphaerales bacterium]